MRISRVQIDNFRNFHHLDVHLSSHAVIVGENKVGKSNFLYALRLILDPSLPESARELRREDMWDGITTPTNTDAITISADLADFEKNNPQTALLMDYLVQVKPMVARLSYTWRPRADLKGPPLRDADYDYDLFGGGKPDKRVSHDVRRRLPFDLMPALRDAESDLARWNRSPLRPLLDKAASLIDRKRLEGLAGGVDAATKTVASVKEIATIASTINSKLSDMVGKGQSLTTLLQFAPTDPDRLIRTLRLFIDDGKRSVSDASLGSANLLYFALRMLEYEQLVADTKRDHTFLGIEEPEAHLHPHLQRLVFRNYLQPRIAQSNAVAAPTTILLTTHSPHIASVAPLKTFVVLRRAAGGNTTEAVSTAAIDISDPDVADLERYIDVTRGELLFARGVVLVEGVAELYLLPVFARRLGIDLDKLGITVCSVAGTMFAPYLKLLGRDGLNIPFAVLTDRDPQKARPAVVSRITNQFWPIIGGGAEAPTDEGELLTAAETLGVFVNAHTLEVELFACMGEIVEQAMLALSENSAAKKRIQAWIKQPQSLDTARFLSDIEEIGKGRFAQRVAAIAAAATSAHYPTYVAKAVKYVAAAIT